MARDKDMSLPQKSYEANLRGMPWRPSGAYLMMDKHVQTDPAGNIKPDKAKSTEKIDGPAMIMAFDRCIRNEGIRDNSAYDERLLII